MTLETPLVLQLGSFQINSDFFVIAITFLLYGLHSPYKTNREQVLPAQRFRITNMRLHSMKAAFAALLFGGFCSANVTVTYGQEAIPSQKEVSVAANYLNNLYLNQWVKLDAAGRLAGSIVSLEPGQRVALGGVPVYLLSNDMIAYQTRSNDDGSFEFSGVRPGAYGLMVRDSSTIGAFSLQVLSAAKAPHLPSTVEARVIRPAGDATRIIRQQLLPGSGSRYPSAMDTDPISETRTFSTGRAIVARNGQTRGKLAVPGLSQDLSGVSVHLLRNGTEVTRVMATADGSFSFSGMSSGVYGLIASGDSGFAATSFEVVVPNAIATSTEKLIAVQEPDSLMIELMPASGVNVVEFETQDNIVYSDGVGPAVDGIPMGFGGGGLAGGGGGGFGGGLGGGGGWAGLAGIGGLIAAVAIVASDDKSDAPKSPQ